jgi:hypothetical protein
MPNPSPVKRTDSDQPPPPIALSESQMCALLAASHPLPPALRSAFLEACAREIANLPESRDGDIGDTCPEKALSSQCAL